MELTLELKQTEGGLTAMCKVMEHYENIAREDERRLIAEEMRQKDEELAALRAQLEALRNGGIAPQNA